MNNKSKNAHKITTKRSHANKIKKKVEKKKNPQAKKNFQYNEKVMIFIEYFINEVKVIECAEYQQAQGWK